MASPVGSDLVLGNVENFERDSLLWKDAMQALSRGEDFSRGVRFAEGYHHLYLPQLVRLGFSRTELRVSMAYLSAAMYITMGSCQWGEALEVMLSSGMISTSEDWLSGIDAVYEKIKEARDKEDEKSTSGPARDIVPPPEVVSYRRMEYVRHFIDGRTMSPEHLLVEVGIRVEQCELRTLDDIRHHTPSGARYTMMGYFPEQMISQVH